VKLLKSGLILLTCSFLGCATTGCNFEKGPKIEVCVWTGDGTAECKAAGKKEYRTKEAHELENYVGTNSRDMEKLLTYCKRRR